MLTFHAIGDWPAGRVRLTRAERSSRRLVPDIERLIDDTWRRVLARPGVHLFDGPMCRMESFAASPAELTLTLSTTSYKPFVGTNLENPHVADTHGRDVMANPIGVSALIETADRFLMMGRRTASVAYYPARVHPFAGALEPRDGPDPFDAVYRELAEELSLTPQDIADVRCRGLVEDHRLRQPELVFHVRTARRHGEVEALLDRVEHHAAWSAAHDALDLALVDPALTPVAIAALLLWGRAHHGVPWFKTRVLTVNQ